ncbi:MAG: histidine--tRNA ligase [Defluviitaleaceae bacterium]|nr:histidine--tRNA ligase [Defluviitaleaceae bacterium]
MIQAPKGTKDVYGEEMRLWRYIEDEIRAITHAYCYTEIRTPIFEQTDLFLRGVGDTTDIVQKEMYTFEDKAGRSLSLRPEATAGTARAYVERGMHNQPQPTRLYYVGPNFRYENTQHGRYRQHSQFGVEVFGAYSAATEAEVISLGASLISRLKVENVNLHINSIGCGECRPVYHARLKDFLSSRLENLCNTCRERFGKNPLRILDCKTPSCQELLTQAPLVLDALDEECRTHFEELQLLLTRMNIPFIVDAKVVRGLDYYTRTVFEFIAPGYTVIGGGRYDGLISEVGGQPTGGVGFGMGIERLVLRLQEQKNAPITATGPAIFIGHTGVEGARKAHELAYNLRQLGIQAESDIANRSVKAQMKYANKVLAQHTMILGQDELEKNTANLKNMQTGEQTQVSLDGLENYLR